MSADCSHIVATNLRCDACEAFLGVGGYPGEEPCVCGEVTIDGHYLSVTVADGDSDVHHYRRSDDAPCEASINGGLTPNPPEATATNAHPGSVRGGPMTARVCERCGAALAHPDLAVIHHLLMHGGAPHRESLSAVANDVERNKP